MPIPGSQDPAIPYGSLIVVSGATGFIGSHVVDQALSAGYRVRGTTRNARKGDWAKAFFQSRYGEDSFELFEVPDMGAESAFDEAVKGAAGFVHVANDMTGSRDPAVAIPRAVNGALDALAACHKEPGLKRFVFTSSSFAVTQPKPNVEFTVTTDTFNEEAVARAKLPDPDGETVYSASKVECERAIAKWLQEHDSKLVVNTVQPNANIGPLIDSANQGYPTSARWVKALWDQDYDSLLKTPPQHFINVQDDARLHIIGLAHRGVRGERIFAIAGPVNLNDIVKILRERYPSRQWAEFPNDDRDLSTFEPMGRVEALLRDAYGSGFVGLEESVVANARDLANC